MVHKSCPLHLLGELMYSNKYTESSSMPISWWLVRRQSHVNSLLNVSNSIKPLQTQVLLHHSLQTPRDFSNFPSPPIYALLPQYQWHLKRYNSQVFLSRYIIFFWYKPAYPHSYLQSFQSDQHLKWPSVCLVFLMLNGPFSSHSHSVEKELLQNPQRSRCSLCWTGRKE